MLAAAATGSQLLHLNITGFRTDSRVTSLSCYANPQFYRSLALEEVRGSTWKQECQGTKLAASAVYDPYLDTLYDVGGWSGHTNVRKNWVKEQHMHHWVDKQIRVNTGKTLDVETNRVDDPDTAEQSGGPTGLLTAPLIRPVGLDSVKKIKPPEPLLHRNIENCRDVTPNQSGGVQSVFMKAAITVPSQYAFRGQCVLTTLGTGRVTMRQELASRSTSEIVVEMLKTMDTYKDVFRNDSVKAAMEFNLKYGLFQLFDEVVRLNQSMQEMGGTPFNKKSTTSIIGDSGPNLPTFGKGVCQVHGEGEELVTLPITKSDNFDYTSTHGAVFEKYTHEYGLFICPMCEDPQIITNFRTLVNHNGQGNPWAASNSHHILSFHNFNGYKRCIRNLNDTQTGQVQKHVWREYGSQVCANHGSIVLGGDESTWTRNHEGHDQAFGDYVASAFRIMAETGCMVHKGTTLWNQTILDSDDTHMGPHMKNIEHFMLMTEALMMWNTWSTFPTSLAAAGRKLAMKHTMQFTICAQAETYTAEHGQSNRAPGGADAGCGGEPPGFLSTDIGPISTDKKSIEKRTEPM